MKSGKRYWSDGTLVAGQQFEYAFDDIGNRTSTKQGGDSNGANLRTATYTPNTLNQYSQRTVPGGFDVIGAANAASTVTVNGNAPYKLSEYFRWEIPVSNGSVPVWQSVTNVATKSGTSETNMGNVYIPKTAEMYAYDFDGNLTSDGRWSYTWDAENRLVAMEAIGTVPSGAKLKLSFEYDHQGRRIRKKVYPWTGSAYSSTASLDVKFLYDGWNLVVEANGSDAPQRQYHWGIDLSGSMQGAGGVGGLLRIYDHGTSAHYYATYDGNGNVASLVRQDTGAVAASYEYGPFGEVIKMSGTVSKTNPFRFSTKYQDDESELLYYSYRFLNASTGRWLTKDPIEEEGGINLYVCAQNRLTTLIDYLGLTDGSNTSQQDIDRVTEQLSAVCTSSCIAKCTSKCTENICKSEARLIAESYVKIVNSSRKANDPFILDCRYGYYCYEWANLVDNELSKLRLSCWKLRRVGYVAKQLDGVRDALDHNYNFASVGESQENKTGPRKECGRVLDPWRDGQAKTYDTSYPMHDWNYVHNSKTGEGEWWNGQMWIRRKFF